MLIIMINKVTHVLKSCLISPLICTEHMDSACHWHQESWILSHKVPKKYSWSHIHNTKTTEHTGPPIVMNLIVTKCHSILAVQPGFRMTRWLIKPFNARLTSPRQYIKTSSRLPEKQMAGSHLLQQQPPTCWSVEMCHPLRIFWGYAMVPADYAMTRILCVFKFILCIFVCRNRGLIGLLLFFRWWRRFWW